jgi:hypothetical protein
MNGCTAVWTTGITSHPHGNGADKLAKAAFGAEHVEQPLMLSNMHDDNDNNFDDDTMKTTARTTTMKTTIPFIP